MKEARERQECSFKITSTKTWQNSLPVATGKKIKIIWLFKARQLFPNSRCPATHRGKLQYSRGAHHSAQHPLKWSHLHTLTIMLKLILSDLTKWKQNIKTKMKSISNSTWLYQLAHVVNIKWMAGTHGVHEFFPKTCET